MQTTVHAGRIEGRQIIIENLPDVGVFELRLETAGGMICGWDAVVPPSNDDPPSPLTAEHKRDIFDKLAAVARSGFPHEVVVLDIRGNAQNVAILTSAVRRGGMIGTGAVGGWVWCRSQPV